MSEERLGQPLEQAKRGETRREAREAGQRVLRYTRLVMDVANSELRRALIAIYEKNIRQRHGLGEFSGKLLIDFELSVENFKLKRTMVPYTATTSGLPNCDWTYFVRFRTYDLDQSLPSVSCPSPSQTGTPVTFGLYDPWFDIMMNNVIDAWDVSIIWAVLDKSRLFSEPWGWGEDQDKSIATLIRNVVDYRNMGAHDPVFDNSKFDQMVATIMQLFSDLLAATGTTRTLKEQQELDDIINGTGIYDEYDESVDPTEITAFDEKRKEQLRKVVPDSARTPKALEILEKIYPSSLLAPPTRSEFLKQVKQVASSESTAVKLDDLVDTLASALELRSDDAVVLYAPITLLYKAHTLDSLPIVGVIDFLMKTRALVFEFAKQDALDRGALPFGRSRLMILGEGAAGKTSFFRALTRQTFVEVHRSTVGVATSDVKIIREAGVDTHVARRWALKQAPLQEKQRAMEQEFKALNDSSGIVSCLTRLEKMVSKPTKVAPTQEAEITNTPPPIVTPTGGSNSSQPEAPSKPLQPTASALAAVKPATPMDDQRSKGLGQVTFSDCSNEEAGALTFSCWDYGGQRQFQMVQHLFLSRFGVYVVAFDMTKLLSEAASQGDDDNNVSLDYVMHWLRQIDTLASGAPIFLIGTHKDEIVNREDYAAINAYLRQAKCDVKLWNHVVRNNKVTLEQAGLIVESDCQDDYLFFPVDNRNSADEIFDRLRVLIESEAENDPTHYTKEKVPISWLSVLDELKSLEESGMSYVNRTGETPDTPTVEAIARECGVFDDVKAGVKQKNALSSMLKLYHDIGVLVNYGDVCGLDEIVILEPQWIVDCITFVVRDFDLHKLRRDKILKERKPSKWKSFVEDGFITEDVLKVLWLDEMTPEMEIINFLINFLEMQKLLIRMPKRVGKPDMFFVPAVLMLDKRARKKKVPNAEGGPSAVLVQSAAVEQGLPVQTQSNPKDAAPTQILDLCIVS